jgi:hypothetical protein
MLATVSNASMQGVGTKMGTVYPPSMKQTGLSCERIDDFQRFATLVNETAEARRKAKAPSKASHRIRWVWRVGAESELAKCGVIFG